MAEGNYRIFKALGTPRDYLNTIRNVAVPEKKGEVGKINVLERMADLGVRKISIIGRIKKHFQDKKYVEITNLTK